MLRIALFELRYQWRQPMTWVATFFFFLLTFGAASSDTVQIGGGIGNVDRNAPIVIVNMLTVMTFLAVLLCTMFVAGSVLRDFDRKSHELVFSRPISKLDYLGGRFLGSFVTSATVFLGCALGIFVGGSMPWLDPESIGPFRLLPYLWGLVVMAWPNILLTSALFFALAAWSRSIFATYVGVVALFTGFFLSDQMLGDLESRTLASMLDPFGFSALEEAVRYWTVAERNVALPELTGLLLWNRALWVAVGLGVLALSCWRFRMSTEQPRIRWRFWRKPQAQLAVADGVGGGGVLRRPVLGPMPLVDRRFDFRGALTQWWSQTRFEVGSVYKGVLFLILVAYGLLNMIFGMQFYERQYGTATHPVTRLMVEGIEGGYLFFLLIILGFYAGELIWRERSVKLDGVTDSMPAPNGVYLGAKLFALMLVVSTFLLIGAGATVLYQTSQGYTRYEPMLYLQGLVVLGVPFFSTCFLFSFFQVISRNKFFGYLLLILYVVSRIVMGILGWEHQLYRFAFRSDAIYSDMNGWGHFVAKIFWIDLYWALAAGIMTCLMILLWQRGTDSGWRFRLRLARQRLRGPVAVALALFLVAFAAVGAYIFYNTNILNNYQTSDDLELLQANYEKNYRKHADDLLPRIVAVKTDVDLFPHERRIEARGHYVLVNENEEPLETFVVRIPVASTVNSLDFGDHTVELADEDVGFNIYRLAEPMAPGESRDFRFDVTVAPQGFPNSREDNKLVRNGTFFNNFDYFPIFGYDRSVELQDRGDRRKHGLPPVERFPKIDDHAARHNTYLAQDSDWITFETTVSTSPEQIAIAPGYLQREWTEGGRRYFHYAMDSPILHFYSYLSADYTVTKDQWNDVAIEIYYHEPHDYNVDRMIDSIKDSLAYFEANFGPYQHRQMRIIEFPRYRRFAQAFPNTVPFSEAIGFIAKLDDEEEEPIDFPYYVTAHEVAHQWWGHQVIGGFVQGATMLSETLAQYSSLMVMREEYGDDHMRRFLKHELDRYLQGRGTELIEEMPLMLVENQQYIHYQKGSVVTYALSDYLGEENLNRAIAEYVDSVKFQEPPFTTTVELLDHIRKVVPEGQEHLIADLFEHITLFENEADEATYTPRDDGTYEVTLVAKAKKLRADGQGVETEIPIDDWIDVGVFGEDENGEPTVLYLEKHHVADTAPTFTVVVDQRPVRAGIDPYNKLVDRNSGDNLKRVKEGEGPEAAVAAGMG